LQALRIGAKPGHFEALLKDILDSSLEATRGFEAAITVGIDWDGHHFWYHIELHVLWNSDEEYIAKDKFNRRKHDHIVQTRRKRNWIHNSLVIAEALEKKLSIQMY
jgi:hypothetical protein